ncbi:hypothetical protein Q0Z83_092600 [Actinoplanes sichuanensis]|uniref:Uncharacterized protein n=1 Tax=Actinoplanes sichuanensis TaxID=512349 RepID=A0ABW4AKE9_9ACTN|nr:hypothetical protein [Actinoplanes sichuanensis]BEL11069.1 hypothetical protein Q0Z83_092600 [Actinoplanes sichuanensis]
MSDEFPRPYAEEPPAAEPVSGFRLVRTRPWAVAVAVLITFLATVSYPLAVNAMSEPSNVGFGPDSWLLMVAIGALPAVVSLTIVGVLADRRVTVGRALGLLVLSIGLSFVEAFLIRALSFTLLVNAGLSLELLSPVIHALTLLTHGLLGILLFPPVAGRNDFRGLVAASLAVPLLTVAESWLQGPTTDPVPLGWELVDAVLRVGWAIAVLITFRPATPAWAVTPADLGRQDP